MKTKNVLIYSGLLLGGLLFGYLLFGSGPSEPQSLEEHIEETHTDEEGNIVYTCSMHPQVRQNEPGNCPICGMELIPANELEEEGSADTNPNAVRISKAAMALAEIQTSPVRLANPVKEIRLPGKIAVDERQVQFIPAHFHGRIEQLYVNFTGEYISKGQKIARVYSPMLFTAQKELLEAYKNRDQNPQLYASSRQKLLNWKIPEKQIDEIIANGKPSHELDIYSHKEGYVIKRHATVGNHLNMGDIMFEISPLDALWGLFEAYEKDVAALNFGDNITFKTEAYPAVTLQGSISYIQPTLNSQSRTVSIRIEIPNTNESVDLKPGMLINGLVSTAATGEPQILIPRSAVMWTGKRSIVFVDVSGEGNPAFEAREVELGSRAGDDYIIESGLEAGEWVVTNGTFKIDAAAQLSDKLSMMNREPGTGANRTGHEDHVTPEKSPEKVRESENQSKQIPAAFKGQLSEVTDKYLNVKNAFFVSNSEKARSTSKILLGALEKVDMSLVKGEAHQQWMDLLEELENHTETIIDSQDIEKQRASFMELSSALIETVKRFEVPGVIYQNYCPMANDGKGANWLSREGEIENPYYGDQMHNCGEIIEKIEF